MERILKGRVWKTGDNITAYQIIERNRWTLTGIDREEMGKWAFEGALEEVKDVPNGFKKLGYDIVVAGHDFGGGGKSIEHPVVAMQGAGVKLAVAESFSRYTYRNAINLGMPAINCKGVSDVFSTGDTMEANLETGEIRNLTTGETIWAVPLSEYIMDVLDAGNVLTYIKKQIEEGNCP